MRKIAVLLRIISLCLIVHTQLAHSADVAVTSDADTGANTLRDALATANNGDTIVFALPAGSTISLASTLTVTNNVVIDGSGSNGLTLDGNHAVTVLTINNTANATISNLTIANGTDGILAVGALAVLKCTVRGSTTGIDSYGTLRVANSTIFGNSTPTVGGGIKLHAGSATIANNTFVNNAAHYGGAIESESSSVSTLTNNLFQGNSATQFGASVYDVYDKIAADHNLYWNNPDLSGPGCYQCASDTNATLADPLLGSLGDHGGPTQTYFPGLGSAAIDTGDDATCAAAPVTNVDQRGGVRPVGAHCDIGAVESDDPVFADGFEQPAQVCVPISNPDHFVVSESASGLVMLGNALINDLENCGNVLFVTGVDFAVTPVVVSGTGSFIAADVTVFKIAAAAGDVATFQVTTTDPSPQSAYLHIQANGAEFLENNFNAFSALDPGQSLTFNLTYSISNGLGGVGYGTQDVTINGL